MDLTTKKVLNFEEACEYTAFRASYLYKLTSSGRIPHYKPYGKMIFFNREELESFLIQQSQKKGKCNSKKLK
jgi:excisionase family DNA binding protein